MAMVKCKECGGDVSDQARACPKCGAIRTPSVRLGRLVVLFLIVGAIFWWIGTQGPELDENLQPVAPAGP